MLEGDDALTVVGVSDGAGGVLAASDATAADVVLWAPARESAPLGRRVATDGVAPAIVALAPRRDIVWAEQALDNGVRGVLEPDPTAEEIVAAVLAAAQGLLVVAPALAATLLVRNAPRDAARDAMDATPTTTPTLTPRELEILGWLAEGLANKQVAARLGLSEHTVKTHLAHVFEKLGVGTRAEAVARAVRLGVLAL